MGTSFSQPDPDSNSAFISLFIWTVLPTTHSRVHISLVMSPRHILFSRSQLFAVSPNGKLYRNIRVIHTNDAVGKPDAKIDQTPKIFPVRRTDPLYARVNAIMGYTKRQEHPSKLVEKVISPHGSRVSALKEPITATMTKKKGDESRPATMASKVGDVRLSKQCS